MMTSLLIVILLTFIGVGLPDSILGTAWPVMHMDLGLPLSLAGSITATVSAGTIVSSLMSARLIRRLGTGMVTALSTLLTAVALWGYSVTRHGAFLFLVAIPMGLGAGSIDTALNSFVATHYSAAKMNYLHCFYGLGVAMSPSIMSWALQGEGGWRSGYTTVALIQSALTVLTFAALPLWRRATQRDQEAGEPDAAALPFSTLMKDRTVRCSCLAFFFSCALELTTGSWASSYFVQARSLSADRAAQIAMLFYVGLTLGRLFSGLMTARLGRRRILRICRVLLLLSILLFMLPLPTAAAAAALFLIGLGIGPVFPNLTHLTPDYFGAALAQSVMGVQQAASYAGIMVMPWLFGVLAQHLSTSLLPVYLLMLLLCYIAAQRQVRKPSATTESSMKYGIK